jgi:hypothetical protein
VQFGGEQNRQLTGISDVVVAVSDRGDHMNA